MRPRSLARRLAFQYLFSHDLNNGECEPIEAFLLVQTDNEEIRVFARDLAESYLNQKDRVDKIVSEKLKNYSFERVAVVEKNILRLAAAELAAGETPFKVVINEALRLAKKFGSKDSHKFVNGILDSLARDYS
ncbi:MAG: transcription antitermination factor NusB [Planctomycetota bacterium]|jgi:N utilization substance protein B